MDFIEKVEALVNNYLGHPSLENNFKNEPVRNYLGHPSLENNFKNEPVRTIKINT